MSDEEADKIGDTLGAQIIFRDSEKMKADLKTKLSQKKVTLSRFFKAVVRAYLNEDEKFIEWLESWLESEGKLRAKEKRIRKRLEKERSFVVANFNLDDKEAEGLFDIFEKEFPDL